VKHDSQQKRARVYTDLCLGRRLLRLLFGYRVLPEAILESSRHRLEIPHPTRSSRLSALCLDAPFVRSQFRSRVPALRAGFMLSVESPVPAPSAQRVRFRVSFTERRGTFCHLAVLSSDLCCPSRRSDLGNKDLKTERQDDKRYLVFRFPHRRHSVCDFVCRLPKDEVPKPQ